jgi:hypothetical protein
MGTHSAAANTMTCHTWRASTSGAEVVAMGTHSAAANTMTRTMTPAVMAPA